MDPQEPQNKTQKAEASKDAPLSHLGRNSPITQTSSSPSAPEKVKGKVTEKFSQGMSDTFEAGKTTAGFLQRHFYGIVITLVLLLIAGLAAVILPKIPETLLRNDGITAYTEGNYALASSKLIEYLIRRGDDMEAKSYYASALLFSGDSNESRRIFAEIPEADLFRFDSQFALYAAWAQITDYATAIRNVNFHIEQNPNSVLGLLTKGALNRYENPSGARDNLFQADRLIRRGDTSAVDVELMQLLHRLILRQLPLRFHGEVKQLIAARGKIDFPVSSDGFLNAFHFPSADVRVEEEIGVNDMVQFHYTLMLIEQNFLAEAESEIEQRNEGFYTDILNAFLNIARHDYPAATTIFQSLSDTPGAGALIKYNLAGSIWQSAETVTPELLEQVGRLYDDIYDEFIKHEDVPAVISQDVLGSMALVEILRDNHARAEELIALLLRVDMAEDSAEMVYLRALAIAGAVRYEKDRDIIHALLALSEGEEATDRNTAAALMAVARVNHYLGNYGDVTNTCHQLRVYADTQVDLFCYRLLLHSSLPLLAVSYLSDADTLDESTSAYLRAFAYLDAGKPDKAREHLEPIALPFQKSHIEGKIALLEATQEAAVPAADDEGAETTGEGTEAAAEEKNETDAGANKVDEAKINEAIERLNEALAQVPEGDALALELIAADWARLHPDSPELIEQTLSPRLAGASTPPIVAILAFAAAAQGNVEQAEHLSSQTAALDFISALYLGRTHLALERTADAVASFNYAISKRPLNADARRGLIRAEEQSGLEADAQKATRALHALQETENDFLAGKIMLNSRERKALNEQQYGRLLTGINERVLTFDLDKRAEGFRMMGLMANAVAEYSFAEQSFQLALESKPPTDVLKAEIHGGMGIAQHHLQKFNDSRTNLLLALEVVDNPLFLKYLAKTQSSLNLPEYRDTYLTAIRRFPSAIGVYYDAADTIKLTRPSLAADILLDLIRAKPNELAAYQELIKTYATSAGENQGTIALLKKAVDLNAVSID